MEPTDWFRVRHRDPFPEDAVVAFRASCAVYRAKVEAMLLHWGELPSWRTTLKPTILFFEPELSPDRRVMSLPIRVENKTLGSRSFLQITASRDLYAFLPFSVIAGIEVGVTEPTFEGPGWRNDWWSPHEDNSIGPAEAFRRQGFTLKADPEKPGVSYAVPGLRRRLLWFLQRFKSE